jgi:hypothetical protein
MTWAALLLADPSPCLRWLTLKRLLSRPLDDPEVNELTQLRRTDHFYTQLSERQADDGSWSAEDLFGSPHNRLLTTSQALLRLGFIGFDKTDLMVSKAADFAFRHQQADGSWPLPARFEDSEVKTTYDMIPLQTAFPLRGLAACGYAADPRAARAYEWLLDKRLDDGSWPTGMSSGSMGYVAGYRRVPHSRWGCRSNTTGALCCLALHPELRHGEAARRALDLLLGRTAQQESILGFETARTIGAEPFQGFFTYFARFDPGLLLWLCARLGASLNDERVATLIAFVRSQQGQYGLWEYSDHPQASRWVTYDLLRSLSQIDEMEDWVSMEPPTPFIPEPYGKQPKRH